MPFGYELVGAFADHALPPIWYGQISSNQPLPTVITDPLYVIFPLWQGSRYFVIAPGNWDKRQDGSLPSGGESCLVWRQSPLLPMICIQWGGVYQSP